MPNLVVCHPATRTMEDGQSTYVRFVLPAFNTPETPNHIRANTPAHTINPTVAPSNAVSLRPKTLTSFQRLASKSISPKMTTGISASST